MSGREPKDHLRAPGVTSTPSVKSVPPAIGPGMITRQVRVRTRDVVFLKGIVEALEGVAQVFAERGGDLTIAAPAGRERELDGIIDDLCRELGAMRVDPPAPSST
ncbi:DUF4911 domain-containing protein [Pendulispora albinea]|uniref:DUF4911 domain-containing protein n=1 Tax=Pendulispora albinea TaxID=2741071 RepID=A0ABZ2M5Y3_9BACT